MCICDAEFCLCWSAMDSVQSELFDLRTKYDEATSAK